MGLLDLLMGAGPSYLRDLFGGGTPPIGTPPATAPGQVPGGIPSTPGNVVPQGGLISQMTGGMLGSNQTLLGNGLLGNAARGALYGAGAAGQPGPKGFWAGFGQGAARGAGGTQQRNQFLLQQGMGQQAMQAGQMALQGQARKGQMDLMTLNYYRRMQGLPEVDMNGNPVQQSGASQGQSGQQQAPGGQGGAGGAAPAPGVPPAAAALAGVQQGSDQWWQQLYAMGQSMVGVPGLAQDAVTLMEKAKAHDPSVIQTEAYAKAVGTAAGTPINTRPGGSIYLPGQGVLFQAPMQTETIDNNPNSPTFGQKSKVWTTAGGAGAPGAQAPGGGAPGAGTNGVRDINSILDKQAGLPPGSMAAIDAAETAGAQDTGPGSVSSAGAAGRYQVMPNTVPPGTDLSNPLVAGPIASKRLAEYQKKYAGWGKSDPQMPLWLGAAAYNWGPANVDKWLMNGSKPDQMPQGVQKYANDYLGKVLQQQQAQQGGQQPAPPAGNGVPTELNPGQVEEIKGEAERNNEARKSAQAAAEAAQKHLQQLDQMRVTADQFRMGAGSGIAATAQSWGQYFGMNSDEANRQLGAYQDMRKLGISAGASAIKDVSSKEALQGQRMIWEAQPNPGMSPDGFRRVVDSLQGADQAVIAKNQWVAQQPKGTNVEAQWLKNTQAQAANAYWLQRTTDSDPALAQQIITQLSQDPAGQKLLQQIQASRQWLKGQGLL